MGYRRRAREQALQLLFSMDLRGDYSKQIKSLFCHVFIPEEATLTLFEHLVEGVVTHMEEIDRTIEAFSSNWRIPRMGHVDRNVLRMAVFEMLYMADIPHKVSINEAIDLAKKFGTRDSGGFVNGILDSIRKDKERHREELVAGQQDA